MREYARHGLSSVVLVHGAGGTGKSAVLHALAAEMCSAGLGELLITAYTGVAAAPFGGPTLLKLVGMRSQGIGERLPKFDPDKAARLHEKFKAEYGKREITDVGALVIDEVSFVPALMLGHFEHRIRTLVATTRSNVDGADAELFGTLPVILSGDNWQLPPVAGKAWYRSLCENALRRGVLLGGGNAGATTRGLKVLQAARRLDLVRLMRAVDDEDFVALQNRLRDRTGPNLEPVITELFARIARAQPNEYLGGRWDAKWRFAPIGVVGNRERDLLNAWQAEAFARQFGLPLIKWPITTNLPFDGDYERLLQHEPGLWGYFVEGAPAYLTQTISSPRKLANGSPALLRSLTFAGGAVPAAVQAAYARGGFQVVELKPEDAPQYVNVIVGGTDAAPRLWHGVKLDDLSAHIISMEAQEQVVPTAVPDARADKSTLDEDSKYIHLGSLYAAQQCYEKRATGIRRHTYSLAFAITDYKLQGKTLPRLLLSLDDNGPAPPVTLAKLYVLISRVGTLDGLRFLPPMPADTVLKRHAGKAPNSDLLMWERGYDGEGRWVDALAVAARKEQDDAAAAAEAARTTQRRREAKERAKAAAKQKNAAGTAARAQTKRAAGGSAPQCPLGVCSGAPTTVTNNITTTDNRLK